MRVPLTDPEGNPTTVADLLARADRALAKADRRRWRQGQRRRRALRRLGGIDHREVRLRAAVLERDRMTQIMGLQADLLDALRLQQRLIDPSWRVRRLARRDHYARAAARRKDDEQ